MDGLRHAPLFLGDLHGSLNMVVSGGFFAGELIAYSTGLLITILLLTLTLRAVKLPGTPVANIVFAACGLCWSLGGLLHSALLVSLIRRDARITLIAHAIQYLGAALFPLPVLAIWRPFATKRWQQIAARVLQIGAALAAAVIAVLLAGAVVASSPARLMGVGPIISHNAMIFLMLGAAISLRPGAATRGIFLPSLVLIAAISGAALTLTMAGKGPGALVSFLGAHLVMLVVLLAFLLFARFRFADTFVRYGVRFLLAGVWAATLSLAVHIPVPMHAAAHLGSPQAVHIFAVMLVAIALLLSFTLVDEWLSRLVLRWIFHPPDYRASVRELGEQIRRLQSDAEVSAAVEDSVKRTLRLAGAKLVLLERVPAGTRSEEILNGEIVELDRRDPARERLALPSVEFLIPVVSAGGVTHVLLVASGTNRPALVTNDLNFLTGVATQCGNRFDALRVERETIERRSREAVLLQQVAGAELRALRSQINPHFLFNSLNTIADLIVRNPPRAEEMTLRLASVFRHVLANSSRALVSVRDEIDFVRTYLYIEEARFGDRLQVEIAVDPEVDDERVPSLILQPLVENALKHGLAPKPGPGHLWISVHAEGDQFRLTVADDGIGLNQPNEGLGLKNVADRLRTLYQDRANVTMEARETGGCRVTLVLPRRGVKSA